MGRIGGKYDDHCRRLGNSFGELPTGKNDGLLVEKLMKAITN